MSDETRPLAFSPELAAWLGDQLHGDVTVVAADAPRSGYSAETTMLTVRLDGVRTERLVLRRETPEPAVYPVQAPAVEVEIEVQYRVMEAVSRAAVDQDLHIPLAPLVGYEADPAVLGAPFFVMGFVDGDVPVEDPVYTRAGFFFEATPHDRRRMVDDGLRVLSELHRVDWQGAGLDWLAPAGETAGTSRQLRLWQDYAHAELGGRDHPLLLDAFTWLHEHEPAPRPVALSWGDPRPGNMIWQDYRCACVTDFEAASIAPPQHDLGWWLMFDRWSHETMGQPRLDGEPTRDEQREAYAELSGTDVGDTTFDEVFAAARYTAIVVRVMNRLVQRGVMPADNTIWIDNPASTCLADLLPRS